MNSPVARLPRSSAIHLLFAFVAMGSWTVFANRAHPTPAPRLAGMNKGGLSACITLFLIGPLSLRLDGIVAGSGHRHLPRRCEPVDAYSRPERYAGGSATIVLQLLVATSYPALHNLSLWKAGTR
jgi:hypothetical protein